MKSGSIKILLVTSAIILLAAACNKQASLSASQSADQQNQKQAAVTKPSDKSISQTGQSVATATQATQNPNIISHTVGQATKPEYKPGFIIINQTVEGSNLNGPYLQLLQGATAQDSLTIAHNTVYKNYGSMGIFVQAIDGITPDSQHFWEFYVNGKSSNIGASSYILKDGDKIEWKLSAISSSGE